MRRVRQVTTWEVRSRHVQSTEVMMTFVQGERGEMVETGSHPEGPVKEARLYSSAEGSCWRASGERFDLRGLLNKIFITKNWLTEF